MADRNQPLFLARASYRKRRLRDGSRLLPIFGFLLLILPLLGPTSADGLVLHWEYLFGVWAGLIAAAAVLSRGLSQPDGPADEDSGPDLGSVGERGGELGGARDRAAHVPPGKKGAR